MKDILGNSEFKILVFGDLPAAQSYLASPFIFHPKTACKKWQRIQDISIPNQRSTTLTSSIYVWNYWNCQC